MRTLLENLAHEEFLDRRFYRAGIFNDPVSWRQMLPNVTPERAYEQLTKHWDRYEDDASAERFRAALEGEMADRSYEVPRAAIGFVGAAALATAAPEVSDAVMRLQEAVTQTGVVGLVSGLAQMVVGAAAGTYALLAGRHEPASVAAQYLSGTLYDEQGNERVYGAARTAVLEKARTYEALESRLHAGHADSSAQEIVEQLTGRKVSERTARSYFTDLAKSGHENARAYLSGSLGEQEESEESEEDSTRLTNPAPKGPFVPKPVKEKMPALRPAAA